MKSQFKTACILLFVALISSCKKEDTKPKEPEVNYTNFKILNVKITAMPFVDANNVSWDYLNGPDVFFKMEIQNNTVLFDGTSSRFTDVGASSLPLSWDFVNAYQITNLSVTHFVTVYDYDTPDPDDEIGYVGFTMQEHKTNYPKSITKSQNGLTITISGEWY